MKQTTALSIYWKHKKKDQTENKALLGKQNQYTANTFSATISIKRKEN